MKGKVALLVRHTRSGEVPHPIYIGLVHEHAHYPLRRELVLAVLGRTLSRPCTAAAPAPPPNQQASRQPTAAGMRPVLRHSRVRAPAAAMVGCRGAVAPGGAVQTTQRRPPRPPAAAGGHRLRRGGMEPPPPPPSPTAAPCHDGGTKRWVPHNRPQPAPSTRPRTALNARQQPPPTRFASGWSRGAALWWPRRPFCVLARRRATTALRGARRRSRRLDVGGMNRQFLLM